VNFPEKARGGEISGASAGDEKETNEKVGKTVNREKSLSGAIIRGGKARKINKPFHGHGVPRFRANARHSSCFSKQRVYLKTGRGRKRIHFDGVRQGEVLHKWYEKRMT